MLGVLYVLNVLNVLNVLFVLNVLNMPMDASLAYWALLLCKQSDTRLQSLLEGRKAEA